VARGRLCAYFLVVVSFFLVAYVSQGMASLLLSRQPFVGVAVVCVGVLACADALAVQAFEKSDLYFLPQSFFLL
jgi:hypothetical protein